MKKSAYRTPYYFSSPYLKLRPSGGAMFIGYAIETLQNKASLHAASTPPVEAALAAGYGHNIGEFNGA